MSLERLLDPRSVAVVGASTSPGKAGYQAVRTLRSFDGAVLPVNPTASEILGFKAYPSLAAASAAAGAPDLVVLAIPAAATPAAVREAATTGCGGVLIVSGGFAETGEEGARLQAGIEAACGASSLRVLGPNTSGFMRPRSGCAASFAPGVDALRPGPIGIVAQSGGVNLVLAFLAHERGLGLSLSVGLGNAVDVDAAAVLRHLAADADTRAIVLHLEGVRDGRALYETLLGVTPIKPVVVLTPGRADIGAFARSHTGNLIGAYDRKVAALRQAGAVVVDTAEEAIDAVAALSRKRAAPKPNPGIGLLTGQAGPGLLIADRLRASDVDVPELESASVERIASLLPPLTYLRNPVDTGRPGPAFPDVLRAVVDDPRIDAVGVFALHEPAALDPARVLSDAARSASKPLAFGTLGLAADIAPTLAAAADAGVPAFSAPERLATALRALAEDARAQHRLARRASSASRLGASPELVAGATGEAGAKALLAAIGIPVPRGVVCAHHGDALQAFAALHKPVAVKILAEEIAHKTEVGGVKLGVENASALQSALAALDAIPVRGHRAYLVEEMAPPGVELILGAVRDPSFGPVVAIGLGGTAAEALQDTAVRLAPLDVDDVLEMLASLRGRKLLEGWRGAPAVDRTAIARAAAALGQLVLEQPEIAEIEINPLRAYAGGVLALDALVAIR